jgi:hypothetical protein
MATVAQLEQEISALQAAQRELQVVQSAVRREIAVLRAEKEELRTAIRKQYQGGDQDGAAVLQSQSNQLDVKIQALFDSPAFTDVSDNQSKIRDLENQLYSLKQKEEFDAKQASGPSATTEVKDSDAGATQNPAPPPASTGRLTTTEADRLAARTESGTNPPVKTLTETQSVPPTTGTAAATEGRPGGEPGAGALGEDGATAANTKQVLDTVGNKPFQPRDNVLDQYASYTYNIGWYILTVSQYNALQNTAKPSISQYNLLMQSGGAPENVGGVKPELTDASGRRTGSSDPRSTTFVGGDSTKAGRNPFFGLDYYLDNLEITSLPVGKGTLRANNDAALKFTVTEPANITLINNLYLAVKELYTDPAVTATTAYYALVIRFYGYDERGNIVQARNSDNNDAVVEKIIPFKLSNIEFEVSNKLVEYQVTGVGVPYNMGFGSNLGVIKSKIELSGATVKDMLTKGVDPTAVSAADGRQTTASAPGIQPGVGINPIQADDTFNQNQADTLNLLAAGGLGA